MVEKLSHCRLDIDFRRLVELQTSHRVLDNCYSCKLAIELKLVELPNSCRILELVKLQTSHRFLDNCRLAIELELAELPTSYRILDNSSIAD